MARRIVDPAQHSQVERDHVHVPDSRTGGRADVAAVAEICATFDPTATSVFEPPFAFGAGWQQSIGPWRGSAAATPGTAVRRCAGCALQAPASSLWLRVAAQQRCQSDLFALQGASPPMLPLLLAAAAAAGTACARTAPLDDPLPRPQRALSALTWPGSQHTPTPLRGAPQHQTYLAPGGTYCGYQGTRCCDGDRCVTGLTCYSGACGAASAPPAQTSCGAPGEECCTDGEACQDPTICRVDADDGKPKCISAAAVAVPAAPPPPPPSEEACPSIADIVRDRPAGDLSTLAELIEVSGLQGRLRARAGGLTALAPNNDAWAALGEATLDALRSDADALQQVRRSARPPHSLHVRKHSSVDVNLARRPVPRTKTFRASTRHPSCEAGHRWCTESCACAASACVTGQGLPWLSSRSARCSPGVPRSSSSCTSRGATRALAYSFLFADSFWARGRWRAVTGIARRWGQHCHDRRHVPRRGYRWRTAHRPYRGRRHCHGASRGLHGHCTRGR